MSHTLGDKDRVDKEIVSVPHSICFSIFQLPSIASWFPTAWIDSQTSTVVTRFLLMESWLLGDEAKFSPYIRCLPSPEGKTPPFTTPLYWTEEERSVIENTNLAQAVRGRETAWKKEFKEGQALLREQCPQERQNSVDRYSFQLYLWAATVLTSRCFPGRLITPAAGHTILADSGLSSNFGGSKMYQEWKTKGQGFSFPILLPLLDLANHDPRVEVTWQQTEDAVKLITSLPASDNVEVFNNYGQKSNEELIMGYGFDLAQNKANHVALALSVRDLPKLNLVIEARTRKLADEPQSEGSSVLGAHAVKISATTYALRKGTHPLASPAAGPLAFMAMNSAELAKQCENPFSVPSFYGSRFPSRVGLCCAAAFFLQLRKQLSAIENHGTNLPDQGIVASNAVMQMAVRYRDDQLAIMRGGIEQCVRTVSGWNKTGRLLTLEAITTGFLPSKMLKNYRKVLHHVVGTRSEEKLLAGNHRETAYVLWILLIMKDISNLDADIEAEPVADGVVTRASLQRWLKRLTIGYGTPGQPPKGGAFPSYFSRASEICWQRPMHDGFSESVREYERMVLVSDLPESQALQDFLVINEGEVINVTLHDMLGWALRVVIEESLVIPSALLEGLDGEESSDEEQIVPEDISMMVFEDDIE